MTTHPPPCPSSQTIASFLDRRLAAAEADAVARHLATCDDCGTTFAESATFLREAAGKEHDPRIVAPAPPSPRPPLRSRMAWGLAASALLALTIWGTTRRDGGGVPALGQPAPSPALAAGDPVALLIAGTDAAALLPFVERGDPLRPRGFQPERPAAAAVRRGVFLADLDVARAAHAVELARSVEAKLASTEAEDRVQDVQDGRLLEACRLAARARAGAFLRSAATRGALRSLAQRTADDAAAERLQAALRLLEAGELDDAGWEQAARNFDIVIAALT